MLVDLSQRYTYPRYLPSFVNSILLSASADSVFIWISWQIELLILAVCESCCLCMKLSFEFLEQSHRFVESQYHNDY